ncbi:MAG: redox-active disulfide protein 2 [Candidatus Aminicenantes bacterium]|nr:redox-active disulfide protein 2 [Candidatus Aminicenantes bacterium]
MEIKVLGPGCPNCAEVEKRVKNALAELGIAADVEKITDIRKMMSYGILATPGLVIDGRVKSSGRVPRIEDIKLWIRDAAGGRHSP